MEKNLDGLGILYLCPTPIGNLEDMTFRAVRILGEADLIAAEDTRHTGMLLKHFDIGRPLVSYHEHNKAEKGPVLIDELLSGKTVALVSDAGMPAISDPGADLVQLAIDAGITVVPLPGPNAALTALIASGLDTTEFTFIGFLPKRANRRKETLLRLRSYEGTLIFYEAPHRLREVLPDLLSVLGNRPVTVGRELTKKFETFTRTTLDGLLADLDQLTWKGEFVLLLGGSDTLMGAPPGLSGEAGSEDDYNKKIMALELPYTEAVQALVDTGLTKKDAIREIARQRGVSRRDVYNAVEAAKEDR